MGTKGMKILVACEFSGVVRDAFREQGHDAWSCDFLPTKGRQANHLHGNVMYALSGSLSMFPDAVDAKTGRHPILLNWDMMIAHPPCDYLATCAAWAFADPNFEKYPGVGYHQKVKPGTLTGLRRREARADAMVFFLALWNCGIPRICIENPIGCMNTTDRLPRPQIIQPHQFGEDASKSTCLWLKNLPPLKGTSDFPPRMVTPWIPCPEECGEFWCNLHRKHACDCKCKPVDEWNKDPYSPCIPRWSNQTDSGQNRLSPSDDRAAVRAITYLGVAKAMAQQWGPAFQ